MFTLNNDNFKWQYSLTVKSALIKVLILAINIYSINLAAKIQVLFTIAKVLALTIVIVGGVVMMIQGGG